VWMKCSRRAADRNRLFVPFEGEQGHIPHGRRVDCQKWIARAEPVRVLESLQPAFRLAVARQGISEPGVAECKAGAELHRFRKMLESEFGKPPARMAESEHEVSPRLFIIERDRPCARAERRLRACPQS